ncbi:MAG: ATP-binding cassette domain-containing protein [Anaerolineae bacterium]|nr:ATP-binding cassette domain-containing protein [Anaerolineae bacterium]
MNNRLVELKNITKSFGNVNALNNVSMEINKPEIVGLIGDNGAGKSTLIKILSGVYAPDSGEIFLHGKQVEGHWSVARAHAAGIETVYQDRALCVQHTIALNIFMGREITGAFGLVKVRKQYEEAERLMREIGFTSRVFTPDSVVATLSGGERQGVAIARALYFEAELLILDEPTNALSLTETQKVYSFMLAAKDKGSSVVFISHNIYHAYDIADRFIILDRGTVVMQVDKSEVESAERLVQHMKDFARAGHAS